MGMQINGIDILMLILLVVSAYSTLTSFFILIFQNKTSLIPNRFLSITLLAFAIAMVMTFLIPQ